MNTERKGSMLRLQPGTNVRLASMVSWATSGDEALTYLMNLHDKCTQQQKSKALMQTVRDRNKGTNE
jgi:hypothetical protein